MASSTMTDSAITAKRVEKDINTGLPAGIQLLSTAPEEHIYTIPTPLHLYIAIFHGSHSAATAIVQSATDTEPFKNFNNDAALKFFTNAASETHTGTSAQLSKPLSKVHLIVDLRHSPHASNIYAHNGNTMAVFARSQVPEWQYKFSRRLEVAIPFLIQDQTDITNYRYGSVVVIFRKAGHEETWYVETFRSHVQVEAHTTDAALDTVYSVLLQQIEKQSGEASSTGDLIPETLGKLQAAVMSIAVGCQATKREAVEIKEVIAVRKAHLARLPKVRPKVKDSGVDIIKYLHKKKGKSE
ncbi:hypothetical protein HII31_01690 [Pseudocercospora fuligena]|uniref:Uncharacterized protein n=1 Tax=Pseudocercospora fuligena TaxID=685502 RepID=A0A8H6VM94_9PEZI|nr:hypothetical protein HII31_01690 [Pseudocercospora fuligena]